MTPAEIDRVFGRGRLRMTTGEHVEVFREEAKEGEPRTFTKRFLETASGDFRPWTEREWRILERLAARGDTPVARVVRFIDFDDSGLARLQTRDAGPTVDQWATLVPLRRSAPVLPYAFGDCPNWWALARQCLIALDALHAQGFVHLELRADNVCIPWKPAGVERPGPGQPLAPNFDELALIDVAFSLLPEVELPGPLPLAREPGYEYQSPRLLQALDEGRRGNLASTLDLDWRCDIFSLAAMLWRYLPELDDTAGTGWTSQRHASATAFVRQLLEVHGAPLTAQRPHGELIAQAGLRLTDPQLAAALQAGSTFDPERAWPHGAEAMPITRIAPVAPRAKAQATRREPTAAPAVKATPARPPSAPAASAGVASAPAVSAAPASAPAVSAPAASVPAAPPPAAAPPGSVPSSQLGAAPVVSAPTKRAVSVASSAAAATATTAPAASGIEASKPTSPAPWATPARVVGSAPAAAPAPGAQPMTARVADATQRTSAASVAAADADAVNAEMARTPRTQPPSSSTAAQASPAPRVPSAPAAGTPAADASATPPVSSRDGAPAAVSRTAAPPTGSRGASSPTTSATRRPLPPPPLAPTPVPILAAAGIGALLVAAAAWWGIDGRTRADRSTQQAAAPAASAAASAGTALATTPTLEKPSETASALALPALAASSGGTGASAVAAASAPSEQGASVPSEQGASALSEQSASPATETSSASAAAPPPSAGLDQNADDWLHNRIPGLARGAERQVAPVLTLAGRTSELRRRSEIRNAARSMRTSAGATAPDAQANAAQARSLNEAALSAYWGDNNVDGAMRLERQAFGANPFDSEVVGNLAFLHLKEKPPEAETARQLALHALTVQDPRFATGRVEDWTTLAIASALTGRDAQARNAWFVSMALTSDLQRQCNAAVRAQATYGERLRPSVQAMLQRARSSPAYGRCEVATAPSASRAKPSSKTAAKRVKRTIP